MLNRTSFSAENAKNTLGTQPIGTVNIGEIFEIDCLNGFGKSFSTADDFNAFMNSSEKNEKNHPCTGPIEICGLDNSDSLAVKILKIEPKNTYSCLSKSTGLFKDHYQGRSVTLYSQENNNLKINDNLFLSPAPSLGFAATICSTPLKGGRACPNGGNLDMPYLKAGATLYLPVNYSKALLALGDVHFVQGCGEVSGMALECDAKVTLQVFKAKKFDFPIIETPDEFIIIGTADNENEARKIALTNCLTFLTKQECLAAMPEDKIYQLLGGIGNIVCGNMCGKTPTVGILIKKNALLNNYGLEALQSPLIPLYYEKSLLTKILKQNLPLYDSLPLIHNGDSRQIRLIPKTNYGIMRFNPVIYSFSAHGPIDAPETEFYRAKINQFIAEHLTLQGISSSTLVTEGKYALISLEDATTHIEVVVKEAFSGSPKHIYKNLPNVETRFGAKISLNSLHKPYVRFDWRLPHPDDDVLLPEGLADYFINTKTAKKTALKTFLLVKKLLNHHDLDITDMCLFLNKNGDKVLTEISPDNMGSLSYIGSIPEYIQIFQNKDKSNTLNKWKLASRLLGLEGK